MIRTVNETVNLSKCTCTHPREYIRDDAACAWHKATEYRAWQLRMRDLNAPAYELNPFPAPFGSGMPIGPLVTV